MNKYEKVVLQNFYGSENEENHSEKEQKLVISDLILIKG